jgi:hypothetical protein
VDSGTRTNIPATSLDDAAVSDLRTGMAGLIVLGIVVAVLVLIYFAWAFYQLLVVGAT